MKEFRAFLSYAALTLVVFWGVLVPPEGKILFGPDITRYHYFQRQFLGQALRQGNVPWWNPFIMAGEPYLEHPQIPVWYPPNALFVLFPPNIAVSLYIAFHLFLAMASLYILSRAFGTGRIAAWGSGVAYGLSAYFVSRIPAGHIDIIAASAWAPAVVAGFLTQKIWLSSLLLGVQLLSGHPMAAVMTLEAVFIVTSLRSYFEKNFRPMVRAGIAVLLGLGIAAIQLLPNAQFIAHSIRTFPFPDSWAQLGTPTIGHLLEFLDPFYFYSRLPDSGFGFEHVGYIGKVSLLFALGAVASRIRAKKKSWEIPSFVCVGLFGLWMWLGNNAPFDLFSWVRSWMPLYSQVRIPARHIVLFVLSASVLFGTGLNLVRSKAVQLVVVGLLLVDLIPFARRHLSLVPVPQQSEDAELVSTLTNDKSFYRFLPNFYHGDPLREVLEFNAPIAHKIQSVSGYDTPPLRNIYEFLLAVNGYTFPEAIAYSESTPPFRALNSTYLNFLNVKYILEPMNNDFIKNNTPKQFVPVKENPARGWRLYENKNVSPRFFIATDMQVVNNRRSMFTAIGQGKANPNTMILIDGTLVDVSGFNLNCPSGYTGTVNVSSYRYGSIDLTTENPCNAFLASSEVMYPGWTAAIDGKQTRVFESNAAFRTVYLPAGRHTIVFTYRPVAVVFGAVITISAIFIVIFGLSGPDLAKRHTFRIKRFHS